MAPSFLSRVLRPGASETVPPAPTPVRRPLPPAGQLRRERRALLRAREARIRDLGGIVLEMVRRDEFREDLVYEQAAELIGLEDRLHELEMLLAASTNVRRTAPPARCSCGAPILWGQHFCANCGRPAGEALVACTNCGHALQADAKFCASCGATAAPDA
jgi:double zinc ribbon protein